MRKNNLFSNFQKIFKRIATEIFGISSLDLTFKSSQNLFEIFARSQKELVLRSERSSPKNSFKSSAWIFERFLKNLNLKSHEDFGINSKRLWYR